MAEHKKNSPVPGLILIFLGIIFLLGNFGALRLEAGAFWAYLLIFIGGIFWIAFLFDRTKPGLLMPGTILLTIGLMFFYAGRAGWWVMEDIWPFFILAPAFGFYAMFLLGGRERNLLVPAGILTVIGVVFLMQSADYGMRYVWPIALIAVGVILLLRGTISRGDNGSGEGGAR